MKYTILIIALILATSCKNTAVKPASIVGVWAMTNVYIAHDAPSINVGSGLTNKKDIYTADGIYHDTDANSNRMTDTSVRRYTINNDQVSIISTSGRTQNYSFSIENDKILKLVMDTGMQIHFKRLSHTTDPIPVTPETSVYIQRLQKK